MKLSIITPYYKTLDYTLKLAKVLEPQLTKEVEWIIVDDGCQEKELDKINARVIHLDKPSGNASLPRNIGLDVAKGEYITFIDSDDMVANNYVKKILDKINEKFDYCYISWQWEKKNVIIDDEPPKWNTCVWNCIYKKELIGDNRFNTNKNIGEDEDFNNRVRHGKKANITDILYIYNYGREDSLTNRFSKGLIKRENLKCGLLVYQKAVSKIGGIESSLYEFFKALYKDYDILFVYRYCDAKQLSRYKRYVRCIQFNNQQFECDKYICYSNQDNIADNVNSLSGEYLDVIHADLSAMRWKYQSHPKTTKHIAVSEIARKSILAQDDRPCEIVYNLLEIQKTIRPLMIMSAQRFSEEKGENEMKMFSRRLRERGIPYLWICFTDNKVGEEEGIMFKTPVLDLQNYYSVFDFFASFSRTESWGSSNVEALSYGLPLIVRDIPVLKEIGFKDEENGYLVKYDMSNIDDVIDKMLERIPEFKYKKKDDKKQWIKVLGKLNKYNNYEKEMEIMVRVEVIDGCDFGRYDEISNLKRAGRELTGHLFVGDTFDCTKELADYLIIDNPLHRPFVRIIETYDEPKVEKPKKKNSKK